MNFSFKTLPLKSTLVFFAFTAAISLALYQWEVAVDFMSYLADSYSVYAVMPICVLTGFVVVIFHCLLDGAFGSSSKHHQIVLSFLSLLTAGAAAALWYILGTGMPIRPEETYTIASTTMLGAFSGTAVLGGIFFEIATKKRPFIVRIIYATGFMSAVLLGAAFILDIVASCLNSDVL